jgi:aspartate aminotransferase-like enzyme
MFRKDRLMVPGPTPLPPSVQAAGAAPMVDERTATFAGLMCRVLDNLRTVIGTTNDVLCFTASTTVHSRARYRISSRRATASWC